MPYNQSEIMTLAEVSEYLKISEKSVQRLIQRGEIPCAKVGNQWRFMKSMIDDWLLSKMKVYPQNDLSRIMNLEHNFFSISRLIKRKWVLLDIQPGDKHEVLAQLIYPLYDQNIITDREEFLQKLMDRERMVSTAIGKGVAIPHVRNPQENPNGEPVLIIGICKNGTHYESHDDELTRLFFLLYTDSELLHLRMMKKLSQLLRKKEIIEEIIHSESYQQMINIIIREEQKIHFSDLHI